MLLNTCGDQMREGMEGTGTGGGPVALDRSDCPGLCFVLCTTRTSLNRHFSNFVSQPTSVLGDIMGILKKKKKIHGRMCPGKCHIKIRYLLKDVLELTPMWVPHEPRRGCNGHCGVTEPPPNADSLQSGVSPAGEVYSTDQSKEFCSVYTRHSVSV